MSLELSTGEVDDLRAALDRHLNELMEELVHTDDREYKAALRAHYERLESIGRRLDVERRRLGSMPTSASDFESSERSGGSSQPPSGGSSGGR